MSDPRKWTPTRVSEENLVRYYFPRPASTQIPQPLTVRQMHRVEEATSGVGDLVLGTIGLAAALVVVTVRGLVWLSRAIRRGS